MSGVQVRIESFVRLRDFVHRRAQLVVLRRVQLDPREHREHGLFVVVEHLDFGDVRAHPGHGMDDRIGQAAIIGPNGGDDDLHGGEQGARSREEGTDKRESCDSTQFISMAPIRHRQIDQP